MLICRASADRLVQIKIGLPSQHRTNTYIQFNIWVEYLTYGHVCLRSQYYIGTVLRPTT